MINPQKRREILKNEGIFGFLRTKNLQETKKQHTFAPRFL